jgi:hypothetical protein
MPSQPGTMPSQPGTMPSQPGTQPGGSMGAQDLDTSARFEERTDESPVVFTARAKAALTQMDAEVRMLESQLATMENKAEMSAPVQKAREATDAARERAEEIGTDADAQARASMVAAINRARQSLHEARRQMESSRTM